MPIKTSSRLSKIILCLPIIFLIGVNSNCQNFKGVYVLFKGDKSYYINIKDSSFQLFTLKQNPHPEYSKNEIAEYAEGIFFRKKDQLNFIIDDTNKSVNDYSADSIQYNFYSKGGDKNTCISISVNFLTEDYSNNYLVITTSNQTIRYGIKNNQFTTCFPDSLEIESVSFNSIGYYPKTLLYDSRFNRINYHLFIKDRSNVISFIEKQKFAFKIKSQKNETLYLNNSESLTKADIKTLEFLRKIANDNQQLSDLINTWW